MKTNPSISAQKEISNILSSNLCDEAEEINKKEDNKIINSINNPIQSNTQNVSKQNKNNN